MSSFGSILGNAVVRREDPGFLSGAERYYDDFTPAETAYITFVRSSVAHANIESVDVSEAQASPGVLAVFTSETINLPSAPAFAMLPQFKRLPICREKVLFVGDIVAAVVSETPQQGVDAAEVVFVDYDLLPANADPERALDEDAFVIWPDNEGGNLAFHTEIGDDDGLGQAAHVAEVQMHSQRLAAVPMETNGVLVEPGIPEGGITVTLPNQSPIALKGSFAKPLELDEDVVRLLAPAVGGGFGSKNSVYREYLITAKAALELGRPVKWTETRSEDMVALAHGRGHLLTAKMGFDAEGQITGLNLHCLADAGAYPAVGCILPALTQTMAQGVYRIPQIKFAGDAVITNTTPVGAYRGAGRPEATQILERVIDVAAAELGVDPVELRRRNLITSDQFPYTTCTGAVYDSGDYEKALDVAVKAADYQDLRINQANRRKAKDTKLLGIGVSCYVEITAPMGMHSEYAKIDVLSDGSVEVRVGTSAHGQGHATSFSMIVQDILGVSMEKIRFVQSDTAEIPRGGGTAGSRSLQIAGSAVLKVSEQVLAEAKELAAQQLEVSVDDIVVGDGGLHVTGMPAQAASWVDLAAATDEGAISHELDFDQGGSTFPFGVHVAVVEVDIETGGVELLRHVAVDDCGIILNPLIVEGQQHGGVGQGAAQALYEWVQYDSEANPRTTNLADYLMPSAADLPSFEVYNTETASPLNPLGAKGIGESGTIGSTPAIHNAVVDALSHLGVSHVDMPTTPERIWKALAAL
ncbi:MAG: xanthine dehydrogenase family protein molybdopterin-binding subunit [Acidimicrobiia bacterium]|nr:xanthine dehydrogenase family protein molybdopterin-binding subunit [Acidimicrobiia bacterium]MYC58156.1 xanthine dehydrogenase family protein molybdopterin-binding subunit [Acidimicrobiia bacterium]MYG94357.1 xanthine dehydrogenase family protein molybdopterin-binding subunit [Acidimicrobiia bacterium]MYI30588.1 xanthine dehydrogenase family protein molybdopterin-binding subunit [Acidimicrobiia bacterium]